MQPHEEFDAYKNFIHHAKSRSAAEDPPEQLRMRVHTLIVSPEADVQP